MVDNRSNTELLSNGREVTFLLQYFYPEHASTAQLMTELAEGLLSKGLKVKVLTGQPSYTKSERLKKYEIFKGIEINRMASTQFNKNRFLGKIINWCSFTICAFWRLLFLKNKNKLFIVSQPPFLFFLGWVFNLIRKQTYICLVYDLYPDILEELGVLKKKGIIAKIWDKANKLFFQKSERIIVPAKNMKFLIENKIKDKNKVEVIPNWADGEFIKPLEKKDNWFAKKYDLDNKIVVLYSGNIGLFHNLEDLLEAAEKLKDNKKIKFVFIGEGGKKNKLIQIAADKKLDNVLFLPYQDKSVLPYSLTSADFSVVSLEKGLDCVAAPCKLYTSMAAGTAILSITDSTSEVADIVEKWGCGINIAHCDYKKIVEVLSKTAKNEDLLKDMKVRSRQCFENNFRKDKQINNYYKIFS